MSMEERQSESDVRLLAELAHSGVAETLTPEQRRLIHIQTNLGDYLNEALNNGKQVVLTGNPGDGKTQQILREQERHPDDEYFYLLDASTYEYDELLKEWQDELDAGRGGILAINDGPLYDMTTQFSDEYSFLETVQEQLENQIVYDADVDLDTDDIVVIDLNNRNVLVPDIIDEAIETLAVEIANDDHNHTGVCQVQYNAGKIGEQEAIRENLIDLLLQAGQLGDHITIRDLVNFLCHCITGGYKECVTDFDESMKYYNLAFSGEGKLFDIFREHFNPQTLTHPFVDNTLWTEAERAIDPRDVEDAREEIEELYLREKRRFLLEDRLMDVGYESRDLYQDINHEFLTHRNSSTESSKEELIERINGYFLPGETKRSDLRLWLSHRYRSKSSLALVSRTTVPKSRFKLLKPRLNSKIAPALKYTPSHLVFEYSSHESSERTHLRIDQKLFSALSALDSNIPYTLREREEEQQLLEFMEEIEYYESYSQDRGQITVKDTETGRVVEIEVEDTTYRL